MPTTANHRAQRLRAVFDGQRGFTVGLEEELMLVDAATLDLAPVAAEVLERLGGDTRFKLEMPAAQLEIAADPADTVGAAAAGLRAARERLAAVLGDDLRAAGAGVHPFSA